ncbi:MAG: carbohydrate ABC transporter permease [Treponema sp.]|nr:carbohydrate ABC transporter permease [Treponema sp.]
MIKQTTGEKVFGAFNYVFFFILAVAMIYPFWHIIMTSFSSAAETSRGGIFLWPRGFNVNVYRGVFRNPQTYTGYQTTIMVTVLGTFGGLAITAMTAYACSKQFLPFVSVIMLAILFTMIFNGGMIPNYLLIRNLNLIDNRLALILPGMVSPFHIIIMRTFFRTIPSSLEESAKIDGANDVYIFARIIIPLSKASLATIGLFIAVGYWNDFFSTVLYINSSNKWSMMAVLRNMITNTATAMAAAGIAANADNELEAVTETSVRAGTIVVATVPILVVYPFLQKHFVKGVMIGSIKG